MSIFKKNDKNETRIAIYRQRMALEAELSVSNVYQDMDASATKAMQKELQKLIAACKPEEEYLTWKENYLNEAYTAAADQKFLTCKYLFAGIGQYEAVIPAGQLESFKCWINGNGSAFFGGERESTEDEIKLYLAQNAAE